MIPTRELPPHLADAVKRETRGETIHWASVTEFMDPALAARWVWLLAVPATAYYLLDSWDTLQKVLAVNPGVKGGTMRLAGRMADLVFTLAVTAACIAALITPVFVRRRYGNAAHVVTDRALLAITATPFGRVTVESSPLHSVLAFDRTQTADGSGQLKIKVSLHRASDDAAFLKFYTLHKILASRQVEDLIRQLADAARAKP